MKNFLKVAFVAGCAILAVHIVPEVQELFGFVNAGDLSLAVVAAFVGFKNIEEGTANPPGIRRIGIVPVADLDDSTVDWPRAAGKNPHVNKATMEITTPIPLKANKTVSMITPADNSASLNFEIQGDRFYQSYKHGIAFDIAGLTKVQSVEFMKLLNTGVILFPEYFDGEIRVVGSKLSPIVLKSKGDTGKKGGDKRGYAVSGDNDSFVTEPPFYPDTLALPGMLDADEPEGGA